MYDTIKDEKQNNQAFKGKGSNGIYQRLSFEQGESWFWTGISTTAEMFVSSSELAVLYKTFWFLGRKAKQNQNDFLFIAEKIHLSDLLQ